MLPIGRVFLSREDERSERVTIGLVGGGRGGSVLLDLLLDWPGAQVAVVVDPRPDAPALVKAKALGIPTAAFHLEAFRYPVDLVLEVTGVPSVLEDLLRAKPMGVEVIGAGGLRFFWDLLQEKVEASHQAAARAERLTALSSLTRLITAASDSREVFNAVARAAVILLQARLARVWVDDPAEQTLRAHGGFGIDPKMEEIMTDFITLPSGQGLVGSIFASRTPEYILDVQQDSRLANQRLAKDLDLRAFAGLPLMAGHHVVGVLAIFFGDRPHFTPDEFELMRLLADQAAIAIANAQLLENTERRRQTAESLAEVGHLISQSLDPQEVQQRIVDSLCVLLRCQTSALFGLVPESGNLEAVAVSGEVGPIFGPKLVFPRGTGVAGLAVRDRRPVVTRNLLLDPRISLTPELRASIEQASFRAVLAVPLLAKDGVIGALGVGDRGGRIFNADEIRLTEAFADQAATALENVRLLQELKNRQARLGTLVDVNRGLSRIQPLEALLQSVAEACGHLLNVDSVGFRLVEGEELVVSATWGDAREVMSTHRLKIGESLSGMVAATGQPLMVPDVANDPRLIPAHREGVRRLGLRAALMVPVMAGERVVGVLSIHTRRPEGFAAEDLEMAGAFAAQAAIALENSRLYGELRRALEEVEASQQRLVQAERLRALGEMAAGVAHDFNNLLVVILGRAELLLARAREPELVRGLELICRAALDGAQTVRRIQEFTQTRRTRPFHRVDLLELLREVVELTRLRWQDEAQSRGLPYEVHVQGGPVPPVAGVAEELREVFTNLLTNALEAMPTGGLFVFHVSADPEWVVVRAEDTGHGMSEEIRWRVFEPFFTTKGPRGTGLGLAVTWGIVTRHGGAIEVESTLGKGSVFTVRLPVGHTTLPLEEPGPAPRPPWPARVLVVEDEPEVRTVLKELLTSHGYTVVEAANGAEGLASCEAESVDVVLCDASMPGMSGWEVAEACRARFPRIPLGFITGWGDQLDPQQLQRHRVRFVLAKPVAGREVLRQVAHVLSASEISRDGSEPFSD